MNNCQTTPSACATDGKAHVDASANAPPKKPTRFGILKDYHGVKDSINRFLLRYVGRDKRPAYHDIDAVCPELRAFEQAFPAIRAELDALLAERVAMPSYHDVNASAVQISSVTPGKWKVFMLELLGYRPERNRARCPATCAALERVPGVLQCFFSVLEPGKSVPKHEGPYVGYLRYHLGVVVPTDDPPKIVVAGQAYTWKVGEAMMFDDSWPHEVVNHSSQPRVVLIVDVPRPLPLLPRLLNHFVLWKLVASAYAKTVVSKADNYNGELA